MKKFEMDFWLIVRIMLTTIFVGIFACVLFCENLMLTIFFGESYASYKSGDFKVCFFDVGQGDCTLITYKDISVVIDSGTGDDAQKLCKNIEKYAGKDIDYFLITHTDNDHTGGCEAFFEYFNVKTFYRPAILSKEEKLSQGISLDGEETLTYSRTILASQREGCEVRYNQKGQITSGENFNVEIIYPILPEDENDVSAVVKAEYNSQKFMFMGDTDKTAEDDMIAIYGNDLDCDVLKIAHHGSKYSSYDAFLQKTSPVYAVISVGTYGIKKFGHAGSEVLTRIQNAGAVICQTNLEGNILFGGNASKPLTYKNLPKVPIAEASVTIATLILITWGLRKPKLRKKKKISKKT